MYKVKNLFINFEYLNYLIDQNNLTFDEYGLYILIIANTNYSKFSKNDIKKISQTSDFKNFDFLIKRLIKLNLIEEVK